MDLTITNFTHGDSVNVRNVGINYVETGSRGKIRDFTILFGSSEKPVSIGDDFFIGAHCYINGVGGLKIGSRVTIAHGSMIFTDSGPNTSPLLQKDFPITSAPVAIGNDVWIGAGAKILPGVTIGNKCVIGAGSIVKDDVEDGTVVGGIPAKMLRRI